MWRTAAVLVAIALASGGCGSATRNPLSAKEYLDRINAVCERYEARLNRVPPPSSFDNLEDVAQSVGRALPLLEDQRRDAHEIVPPPKLVPQVRRFFADTDGSIEALRELKRSAEQHEASFAKRALLAFLQAREAARRTAAQLGVSC